MAKKKLVEVIENSPELDAFIEAQPEPTYEVIKSFKADLFGVKYDCQVGDVVALDDFCYKKLKDYVK